jgi:hypothetical protein
MVLSRTLRKFQVRDGIKTLIESEPHEKTCHIHLCVCLFAYIQIPSSERQAKDRIGDNRNTNRKTGDKISLVCFKLLPSKFHTST